MLIKQCALCNSHITHTNDSKEHIIPNALGGRKTIKGFICKACNGISGSAWDSELAKQLNPLSLFFNINRDRGKVPSEVFETTGGEKLKLNDDGSMSIAKPSYTEIPLASEKEVKIQIKARSLYEVKKMLKGVKRKYPKADLDALLTNVDEKSSYCSDMLKFNLSFGGQKSGRSIVKSALALAAELGIRAQDCEHAIGYLKENKSEACFGYYYEKDLIKNRPIGAPIHCISIKGDSGTQQLLGYVEYFGVQRMVLCLSSCYKGMDVENTYSINPMNGKELDIKINLSFSADEIKSSYNYKKIPNGSIKKAFSEVISAGMKIAFEKEKEIVINDAVLHAFKNCGAKEGEILTPHHIKKLSNLMVEKLEPFFLHQLTKNRKAE